MTTGKLLLTSNGITNDSIRAALVELLGKPIEEASALFMPTAIYAFPDTFQYAWQAIKEQGELGWNKLGVLDLTALPSLPTEFWLPQFEATDAIVVGGGNEFYLSYWMQQSGLFDVLPRLLEQGKVYVGTSAGSMVVTSALHFDRDRFRQTGVYFDDQYGEGMPSSAGSDKTLPLVDLVIRPHLNTDFFPQATLANMEQWASLVDAPLYALDDDSAVKVIDGQVEVVSEGQWKLFRKP
ncbi:MAG: Type 1 glutamine amidotransferase-like domain-containing protein [Anaerolineae bacterium]|nr:Type 1 glutamine amidotransferase-like domain-containing protein [Anaerolineae bacterium]